MIPEHRGNQDFTIAGCAWIQDTIRTTKGQYLFLQNAMEKDEQNPPGFDELQRQWTWQPIRHCPGRYVLRGAPPDLSMETILGSEIEIRMYHPVVAKDTVLVARFRGGGMISYKREGGTFLHTLNTADGFARKLRQLGIEWTDDRESL